MKGSENRLLGMIESQNALDHIKSRLPGLDIRVETETTATEIYFAALHELLLKYEINLDREVFHQVRPAMNQMQITPADFDEYVDLVLMHTKGKNL